MKKHISVRDSERWARFGVAEVKKKKSKVKNK